MTHETEITEKQLENILINPDYKSLKAFDFTTYNELVRERKRHFYATEEDFQAYKKDMMKGVSSGYYDKPVINIDDSGKAECIDGEIRLLTAKVLGIDPVIDVSFTELTCKIEKQRLFLV